MGVSPLLAHNIANNKNSSIGMRFGRDHPQVITIIGQLVPFNAFDAVISMNYTKVTADNQTMYSIPLNMLTGNTRTTHVIFAIDEQRLTLYAVDGSKKNIEFSVEWTVSSRSTYRLMEKWVHIPTKTEAISFFEMVENPLKDHFCSLLPPMI